MYPHTLHGILFSLLVTGMLSPHRTGLNESLHRKRQPMWKGSICCVSNPTC